MFCFLLICKNILNHDPDSNDPTESPRYEGIELTCRWKVVGTENVVTNDDKKKQVVTKWEECTTEDSFSDVSKFASDLSLSLENRIESCGLTDAVGKANFFDIEETFNSFAE